MNDSRNGEGRFWATVAFAVIVIVALSIRSVSPDAKPDNAPVDEFSAGRSIAVLKTILGSEKPHPTGTVENDLVRERIVAELEDLGYAPEVEEVLVCNDSGSCAVVRNVVAELDGRTTGAAVLLNAHYDSVGAGPGAGDDGAGVAVLLEVARVLASGPAPAHSIRFLFDDGEEAGLLGAEAWIRARPSDETIAVLVLEARGSSGPAVLVETSAGNLELVRAYASAVSDPVTSSVFFSIYELLPNRTNFTVFKRAGYEGLTVAFFEDPAQYHTPLNQLSNLSDVSVQHMGEWTLALARELSAGRHDESRMNASYFDLLGTTLIFWPETWNIWLAVAALLLVAVVGFVAMRRDRASPAQVLAGWLVLGLTLAASAGLGYLLWRLSVVRSGSSSWIANGQLLFVVTMLLGAIVVTVPFTLTRRPPTTLSMWTAVWLLHGILGVILARLLSGGAYLFFIPALAAGLSGLVSMARRQSDRHAGMMVVPFGISMILIVPILLRLYDAMGLAILPAHAAIATLVLWPVLVASAEARRQAMFGVLAAAGAVILIVVFLLTPIYSESVPRALNIVSVEDGDEANAVLLGVASPLPEAFADAADWARQPVPVFASRDDATRRHFWSTPLDRSEATYPEISGSSVEQSEEGSILRLEIRPVDSESEVQVHLPRTARPQELAYGDLRFKLDGRSTDLTLRGLPPEGAVITTVVDDGTVEVREVRRVLPSQALAFAALRGPAAVPIGPGDRSVFIVRTEMDDLVATAEQSIVEGDGVP